LVFKFDILMGQKNKIRGGYTLMELMITLGIIAVLLGAVLANFNNGRKNSDLDAAARQAISAVKQARDLALAGQIDNNGDYPVGGFLAHFEYDNRENIYLASSTADFLSSDQTRYDATQRLINGVKGLGSVQIISLCGLKEPVIDAGTGLPCTAPSAGKWQAITWGAGAFLDVGFIQPGGIAVNYQNYAAADAYNYIGGVIQQPQTLKQAYFYISLINGAVSGGLL
jgi:prepilin-type N-terminal cleavage/methylation domain-containing protein